MDYPGLDGFLGTRASLMLDIVAIAMFVALPVMGWSIYQVKVRKRFELHKRMQLGLAVVLGAAVLLFEIEMRVYGWRQRAEPSPFYDPTGSGWVHWSLWLHLLFSISTLVLWIFVIVQAVRKIPNPPRPSEYSQSHKFWARIAAFDLFLTSVTGWVFYYLAFMAS